MKLGKFKIRIWLTSLGCALLSQPLQPQRAVDSGLEITTQERLETEPWWPTMATAPLKAYAGSTSCNQCHRQGAEFTSMRHAAETGDNTQFLTGRSLSLEVAPFRYGLTSTPQGLSYGVSDGDRKLSQKLAWVIGAGDLARTFLYQSNGRWMQSEMSFYTKPASLDITTGLGRSSGSTLPAALGQQLSAEDARSCFSCHTVHATTSAGLEPLHAEPGLGCEACHGPGHQHVDRMAVTHESGTSNAIFDPSKLSPSDSIDFCGSCHRTSADAKLSVTQAFDTTVIRFQPYRLEESKCWRATRDQRLTCVACHDPHKPLERDALFYDGQCLQCHNPVAKVAVSAHTTQVCPKASSNCVSCHMPKVAIASMHGEFTDHYIRVVRAGEPSPR